MKLLTHIASEPLPGGRRVGAAARGWPAGLWARDMRTTVVAALFGIFVVVLIAVPLAAALNIWIDEAFTLHTTGAGVRYAISQSIEFEAQPPLYFIVEAGWRLFDNSSVLFARVPSVVFAAAAVAVIVFAARRIAPAVPPLVTALVTALNPLLIWAAAEMRVYALVILVGAVLTWTLYEGFFAVDVSPRARSLARAYYGAAAIVGLYSQYYVGFLLIAHALTIIVARRGALKPFVFVMVAVAVAFAPFLHVALVHVAASGQFVEHATLLKALHELTNAVFAFVLPHDIGWSGAVKYAGFALAGALLTVLVVVGRPAADPARRAVFVQWLAGVAIFTLLFWLSGIPVDPERHLVILAPASLLAALLFVASVTRRRVFLGSLAAASFAVFSAHALWMQYRPPLMKLGDWNRVAATLLVTDRAAPVAVFPAEAALALGRYLPAVLTPIPYWMPFTVDYVGATTLTGESQVARVLDPLRMRTERLWIVTTGPCIPSLLRAYNYNCQYLETYLQRRYRVVKSVAFRGALARLYAAAPVSFTERK